MDITKIAVFELHTDLYDKFESARDISEIVLRADIIGILGVKVTLSEIVYSIQCVT